MGPAGLTAVFGMGTGVAPPVWSPEKRPGAGGGPTVADGAVGVGANQEAITHLQSALELTTAQAGAASAQQRDAIRFKLAGLHFRVGER